MRLAIYYRVSTDKQDIGSQRIAIDAWIASNKDLNITTIEYIDPA